MRIEKWARSSLPRRPSLNGKQTLIFCGWVLATAVVASVVLLVLVSWGSRIERTLAPGQIPVSDFQTPEQLADELSKRAGTRISSGPGWWSVEITRPVVGPFGVDVSCRRYTRTVANLQTSVVDGDWRFDSDGQPVCRYPAAPPTPA